METLITQIIVTCSMSYLLPYFQEEKTFTCSKDQTRATGTASGHFIHCSVSLGGTLLTIHLNNNTKYFLNHPLPTFPPHLQKRTRPVTTVIIGKNYMAVLY